MIILCCGLYDILYRKLINCYLYNVFKAICLLQFYIIYLLLFKSINVYLE